MYISEYIERIKDFAKYIQFPISEDNYIKYEKLSDCDIKKIPYGSDNTYKGLPKNDHHYTTKWHREVVMPLLGELLDFDYNVDDFYIVPYFVKNSFDISFDLSYMVPKNKYIYKVQGFENNIIYDNCDFCKVMGLDVKSSMSTPYHKLYRFPHSCSRIVNKSLNNGRLLFVSGDSQMIPSIPMLTNYFEEVCYFDNRTGWSFTNGIRKVDYDKTKSFIGNISDIDFTDILFALYANPLSYYFKNNLK